MSLYDTLQKTKKELPYRFQRLQAEADAKRSEPVPYQEKDTQNSRKVSREQGIRDSYRQRVENDRNTALASIGNQGVPTGETLIEKATGGLGQAGTIPQQKSVRQYLGLDSTERQEETPKPKSTLELLEQQREENAKKITEGVLPEKQTASFLTWLDSKAGLANRGVTKTIDVAANAIPMLEGAIMGENPDSTLTGQLLKPLTDATGKLDDWTARETENAAKLVDETIGDNQALRLVSDLGGGVITALPTAALAMMTGGASAGGTIGSQLAPQVSGLAATVSSAWQKLISNPMFKTSFIQSLGSGYEEAKEAGASDVNAMAAALLSTTANSIVEVGGGVETLPGELKNADLSTGKKALQWLTSALDEGKEEVVQGAISNMVNKAASGSDTPYFSITDENAVVNPLRMGKEFGMGTAVGGILGGGQVLADSMLQKASNRSGNALDAAIQKIFDDNNKKLNIDNTESQAYNGINENGGALDGRNNQLDGASGEGVRTGRGGSWTDSGSQDGRRFGQDDLSVPGIVLLSPEAQQTLTERGIVNVELHDSSMDNTAFSAALDAARVADSQNGWAVTPKDDNELTEAGTRTFLDRNGSAGFAIATDGDIEAVFANKTAGAPKGATKSTIPQAIANGGTKLDCYGHGLVRLYGRYGFIPVARVIFNPEYANPGWTADKGMPDIYFMMHNGDSADTVVQNMGKYKTWSKAELEALPLMEYDEAYKYRDSLMNSGNGGVWKLDAAIRETMKPAQELENLNNAIDGLFAQNKTAKSDTGAESTNVNTNPAIQTPQEQAVDAPFNGMDGDIGDMGAKTSDFEHKVKKSQTAKNTIGKNEARWNVPEDQRVNQQYDAVTERESLNNARMRIEQDLPGEQEALRRAAVWSNEEVDMGMLILGGLRKKAKETGDWTDYKDWAEVVKQHGVASGQGLQAWAKYTRRTGDGIMKTVAGLLESPQNGTDVNDVLETASHYADRFDDAVAAKSVSDLVSIIQDTAVTRKTKRSWGKKLGGEIDWALNRIADYADAEVRAAMTQEGGGSLQNYEFLRDFAAASIEDIAGDNVKSSVGKMALTVRRMSMLSKVSTIMRNLVGNGAFDLVDTLARNISVPLDMLLSKVTGTRSVAFDSGALSKTGMKGQLDGLAKALLEVGLDVNAGGASSKYENSANRTFKMSGNVVSKLFSTWEKYMGYALNVTDEMKKGSVDARVQKGLDKLYEQGKIKDDSLRSGGQQEALYRTFQDNSALSEFSIGARNLTNRFGKRIHLGSDDASIGDVLFPFAQVPANLVDRGIDYSPAGLAESAVRLASVLRNAKNGKLTAADQAQAVQTLGRNITGSALIAIAAGLALKGFIRVVNPGDEDENKDKAAFEKMQGQSGTQFNVSAFLRSQNGGSEDWQDGDTLVSIAFLEPFNAHLTIGALLAEDMKEEGQLTAKTIANDTFTGSLASILDLPMFEKFRDVLDAYTYSTKERTGEKLLDALNTLAANEVGSLIPNAWKGIAQGLDPYQRDLYSKDGAWEQAADQFRAVFDRDSLPIKQDSFGRDMMNEGGVLNFLNANILPGQITTYKTDELLDKITDLSELTGKASVYPSRKAPDKITVDGEDVPLNQEQQRQYQSTYGQTEYETRSAMIENSLYGNLTPQEEIKAHSFAEDYAKQVAKSDINADFEPDSWVKDLEGKTPAEVSDAIMLKTMESIVGNKKVYENKYYGMADLLEKNKLDDAIAITMMPETMQTAYRDIAEKGGVSVQDWMDTYAYAYANGKTNEERRSAAMEYIDKQNLSKSQKTALANGLYSYLKDMIPKEVEVSDYWLLDQGTSGLQTIEANMSDDQKKHYDAYIKNSGVDMKNYLDAWNFKSTAKSDKDKNDKVTYSAQNKVIDYIDKMNISKQDKRNIFLGLGYAKKNIPSWWK